jgi:hypothetical protein
MFPTTNIILLAVTFPIPANQVSPLQRETSTRGETYPLYMVSGNYLLTLVALLASGKKNYTVAFAWYSQLSVAENCPLSVYVGSSFPPEGEYFYPKFCSHTHGHLANVTALQVHLTDITNNSRGETQWKAFPSIHPASVLPPLGRE